MTKQQIKEQIQKLKELSNNLQVQIDDLEGKISMFDSFQLAYKICLNSTYGIFGSVYYPCFDLDNAEATTLCGQYILKEMVGYTNKYIKNHLNITDPKFEELDDYIIAGDTDSIEGSSVLTIRRNNDRFRTN